LAHGNTAVVTVGCPSLWRELLTASPFIASPPIASRLHLGEHRLLRGAGEGQDGRHGGPVPALPHRCVRVWPEDPPVVKKKRGRGVFVKELTVGIVSQISG